MTRRSWPDPTAPSGSPTTGTAPSVESPPRGWSAIYFGKGIDDPLGISAGPDGALWFTNYGNNSIGRITTTGVVTNFTGAGIDEPAASPPGLTGPCGSPTRQQLHRPDHHGRGGHQQHRRRHRRSRRDRRRARRGPVVHQQRQQLDRPDHHRRGGHRLHRRRHRRPVRHRGRDRRRPVVHQRRGDSIGRITTSGVVTEYPAPSIDGPYEIAAGPDGPCGSPTPGQAPSAASPPPGRSATTRARASATSTSRPESRPDRTEPCGSPTPATAPSDASPPPVRSPTTRPPASGCPIGSSPDPTALCGSPTTGGRSGGSPPVSPRRSEALTPKSGPEGTNVTITGQNLGGATAVAFDGVAATIVSDTADQIVAVAPVGAGHRPRHGDHGRGHLHQRRRVFNVT